MDIIISNIFFKNLAIKSTFKKKKNPYDDIMIFLVSEDELKICRSCIRRSPAGKMCQESVMNAEGVSMIRRRRVDELRLVLTRVMAGICLLRKSHHLY